MLTAVRRYLRGWLPTFVMLGVLLTFRSSLADWYDIPSGSMQPTILAGDRVVVNKLAYGLKVPFTRCQAAAWAAPKRGDIVTFASPADGERLIKRVVAIGGDQVAMRDGRLWLNGALVPYTQDSPPAYPLQPADVPPHRWLREHLPGGPAHPVMAADARPRLRDWGPVRVPAAHVLVLGDNRDNSADGRVFGFVPYARLEGRAEAVALSLDRDRGWKPRWGRFGRGL
ncbi:MAG: signal peptidase I [Candidatus Krumholzibacteria bacterium]|jgi:signal peptidase I|nr:signal peptidase I [Candidatus Krumholzibacteria bacterium]